MVIPILELKKLKPQVVEIICLQLMEVRIGIQVFPFCHTYPSASPIPLFPSSKTHPQCFLLGGVSFWPSQLLPWEVSFWQGSRGKGGNGCQGGGQ